MKRKNKSMIAGLLVLSMCASSVPFTGMQAHAQELLGKEVRAVDLNNAKLGGYWNFDQTVSDGTVLDQTSNNLNGTLTGSVVHVEADTGISGGALRFDDTTADAKGYMDVNANVNAASDDFSVSLWVKYDENTISGRTQNINLIQQSGNGRTVLYLSTNGEYRTFEGGSDVTLCSETPEANKWYHLVYTSSKEHQVQLYVNGVLAGSASENVTGADAATNLRFGAHKNEPSTAAPLKGYLDEIYFYKEIVNESTVAELYSVGAIITAKEELTAKIADAQNLLTNASAQISEKDKAELQTAITNAQAKLNATSAEEVKAMVQTLQTAMDKFNAIVSEEPIQISIDPTNKVRDISPSMFGINHRYANDGYGTWDTAEGKMREEFDQYYREASFGSLRYPGGTISNLFDWKKAIGDVSTRIGQIHGLPYESNPSQISYFGLDEAAAYCNQTDTEMVYVYGMGQGSAADAADLIEYLNAPNDGSNPNGGTDWAAVRAANGHEEPYNIKNFEIGNEMNLYLQDYWMSGRPSTQQKHEAYIYGGVMNITRANQNSGTDNRGLVKPDDWRPSASLSSGEANQELYMRYDPIVENSESIYVGETKWTKVDSLEDQSADANVYTVDYKTGRVNFGDGVHGAIPTKGQKIMADYQTDQDGFIDYYQAMKAVDSSIKIYAAFQTADLVATFDSEQANNQYDGVSVHPYSDTGGKIQNDDPDFYEKVLAVGNGKVQNDVQSIVDAIAAHTDENDTPKVPVVSEFGIFNHQADIIKSQTHAVYIAMCMMQFIDKGTPYINKHCLSDFLSGGGDSLGPSAQAVIQSYKNTDGTVDFVSTPSAKAFSIFNNMSGNVQVSNTTSRNPIYYEDTNGKVKTLYTYSTKDDDGNVYLIVVNIPRTEGQNTPITIDCGDASLAGKTVEVWTLDGDSYDAMNTLEDKEHVTVEKKELQNTENAISYELTPHSITAFKIPKATEEVVRNECTITFDANGGTVENAAQTQLSGKLDTTIGTLPTPVNGTKVFKGWFATKNGGVQLSHRDTYKENMTVYALWEDSHVIRYETKGGNIDGDETKLVSVGMSYGILTKPKKAGYTFDGWYLDEECTKPVNVTEVPTEDVTIYAKWNRTILYTKLTGLTGTASSVENNTVAASNALDNDPSTLWHSKYDGSNVTIGENGQNNDYIITLPAVSDVGKFDYLPRSSGSNGTIVKYKLYYSESDSGAFVPIPGGEGTWENSTNLKSAEFASVQAKRIQIRVLQTEGDAKNKYISAAEFMLYSAAEESIYTIEFEGGENATGKAPYAVTAVPGDGVILPENTFAKDGYEFTGWTDGKETWTAGSNYVAAGSVKLTAVWKQKEDGSQGTEDKPGTGDKPGTEDKPGTGDKPGTDVTPEAVKLSAPAGLKATKQTTSSVTFAWDKVKDATAYVVESYDEKTGKWSVVKEIADTTLEVSGLKSGTICQVRVKAAAVKDGKRFESAYSDSVRDAAKPAKMTLKKVRQSGASKVVLKWAKKKDCSGYEIYMKAGKAKYKKIASKSKKVTTLKRGKMKRGTKYMFKARSYVKVGNKKVYGAYSKVKKIKIK